MMSESQGVSDRARRAIARMDQVRRETAERRSLRQRNTQAKRERAQKAMRERVPAMIEAAKQAADVAQRRGQAGGWATTNTDRDRSFVMGFGIEDENAAGARPGGYRPPAPTPARPPAAFVPVEEEKAPEPPRPEPAPPAPPSRPARERPAKPALELDDEDDFSNQSSWLRNQ
jgi:hypothetical protein